MIRIISGLILVFLVTVFQTVFAQAGGKGSQILSSNSYDGPKNTINMCPGGLAFGIVSVNYEHLFNKHHSLMARVDYEAVPKSYSDANIEVDGKAFVLNYRYHIGGGLNSYYVGAYSRYRRYDGSGKLKSGSFDFTKPDVTFGLNVGKRWIWKSGFTMNLAFGYGIAIDKRKVNNRSVEADTAIDVFEKEYDFINPFLGEFSIGYAF